MDKSPISVLQEICVLKNIVPTYIFMSKGNVHTPMFECVVKIGSIEASGIATNKKEAKNISANNALKLLNFNVNKNNNNIVKEDVSTKINSGLDINKMTTNLNYVGILNEFASKNGLSYAVYVDKPSLGGFCYECHFCDEKATGYGPNKKIAKQDAAKQMSNIVSNLKVLKRSTNLTTEQPNVTVLNEDYVTKKFNELSVTIKTVEKETTDHPGIASNPSIKVNLKTVEEMWKELEPYEIDASKIETIQSIPTCILMIKIPKNSSIFMGFGNNKTDAIRDLLSNAMEILRVGSVSSIDDL